jgi:hypothetical protein
VFKKGDVVKKKWPDFISEYALILERTFGIICACFSIWIRPLTDCLTGKESKKG